MKHALVDPTLIVACKQNILLLFLKIYESEFKPNSSSQNQFKRQRLSLFIYYELVLLLVNVESPTQLSHAI